MRALMTILTSLAVVAAAAAAPLQQPPTIQVALLLDTSNSMDGLIDQARTQLWTVVNELATLRKGGQAPHLEVALYEYGNSGLTAGSGFIRQVLPLTTDLDRVSESLFALRTNGGDEYCGAVIREATSRLAWSDSNADLKAIFIAGNEPFSQGSVDFRAACREAIAAGIQVNTVFCGSRAEGESTGWKEGAELADGRFATIDQSQKAAEIVAPQDAEIARLGAALNATYLPFGVRGGEGKSRQEAQDSNARAAAPSAAVQRQVSKSQAVYSNASWDLVDAVKEGKVELDKVSSEELPGQLKGMSPAEREAFVKGQAAERARLQQEIKRLGDERAHFIATARARQATTGAATLDEAVIETVRSRAAEKGFDTPQ